MDFFLGAGLSIDAAPDISPLNLPTTLKKRKPLPKILSPILPPVHPKIKTPRNKESFLNPNCERLQLAMYACELICKAGIMLQVPQVVIASAQCFLQRFYRKEENRKHQPFHIAMTCIYLACKTQEERRHHSDIINVFDRLTFKIDPSVSHYRVLEKDSNPRYDRWRKILIDNELLLLRELGYHLDTILPHQFILEFVSNLACDSISQKAWEYLNDSFRIPEVIDLDASVLACAAIFLAARNMRVKLPNNPPWYECFGADGNEIRRVAQMILEIYELPKSKYYVREAQRRKEDKEKAEARKKEKLEHLKKKAGRERLRKEKVKKKEKREKRTDSKKRKKEKKRKKSKVKKEKEKDKKSRKDRSSEEKSEKRARKRRRSDSRDRVRKRRKRSRSRSVSGGRSITGSPRRSLSSRRRSSSRKRSRSGSAHRSRKRRFSRSMERGRRKRKKKKRRRESDK